MLANKDSLTIGNQTFSSRLFTGTGKYHSRQEMQASLSRSGCEMVTVADRRIQKKNRSFTSNASSTGIALAIIAIAQLPIALKASLEIACINKNSNVEIAWCR